VHASEITLLNVHLAHSKMGTGDGKNQTAKENVAFLKTISAAKIWSRIVLVGVWKRFLVYQEVVQPNGF